MAAHAARRLLDMAGNLAHIIGIELVVAAQGIDLRKDGFGLERLTRQAGSRPLKTSPSLERVFALTRGRISKLSQDRILAADLTTAADLVLSGAVTAAAGHALLPGLGEAT